MTRRKKASARWRGGLFGAVDVGTTKIACFVARPGPGGDVTIVGSGHHAAHGLRGGTIVDLDAAETSIRTTVETAERLAGENIRQVVVNVSAGAPQSTLIAYEIDISGHEIGDADIRRILDPAAVSGVLARDHEVIHAIPVGYTVDGTRGVQDPRGLYGHRLGVNLHLISAASGAVRNVTTCVSRCHLDVAARVVTPYASALGCLVDDEIALGVTIIDMGGGTTSVAVFFDGELVHTDLIPVGGQHVTNDIAQGLSTPLAEAERIKTLYGSCLPSPSDDRQLLEVPPMGEGGPADTAQVPRSMLVNIIRPRIEEIFEMIRTRLEDAGFEKFCGRRIVLTGGGSLLPGTTDLAGMVFGKQVRMGRPLMIRGMPQSLAASPFSAAAGLLRYAARHVEDELVGACQPVEEPTGRLGRLSQWLRENF